jgi:phospholipase/carboxylesterase
VVLCSLVLAALLLAGCSSERPGVRVPSSASEAPRALAVRWVGDEASDAPLVVLMHGYGAAGDDLVFVAEELHGRLEGRVRFALPVAPLPGPANGLAWWPLNLGDERPADRGGESPAGLALARRDVIAWLEGQVLEGRLDPSRTVIAGFSQGAMLAADVAIEWDRELAGAVMLSGGPIDVARWERRMRERRPPPFLITHGEGDPLLAFSAAARLRERIEAAGGSARLVGFSGRHGIPPVAVGAMEGFLRSRLLGPGPRE